MNNKVPALRALPDGYVLAGIFELKPVGRLILLNIIGTILFMVFGWLFVRILFWMRPVEAPPAFSLTIEGTSGLVRVLLILIGTLFFMLCVHEGIHGSFFWLFTRTTPKFAFKGTYAYAAAPGWYFPRREYFLIAISPFIFISLAGLLLMMFIPPGWFIPLLLVMVFNAGGAVGDLWVVIWLLTQPPGCLALDDGDSISLFIPFKPKNNSL